MFCTTVRSKAGRFLGRIALREDMDDRPMSPDSIIRNDPIEPSRINLRQHRDLPVAFSAPNYDCDSDSDSSLDSDYEPIYAPQAEPRRYRRFSPPAPSQARHWGSSEAINQWRDMATSVSSSSEQASRRRSEDEQQNNDSPRKSRDVTAHLKYLVRGFLRQFRSEAPESKSRKESANNECFIPSPKITFLIDEPDNLVCQICQKTSLKMAITAANPAPEMTAILPCGHISCYECMETWLAEHTSCPFCRTDLAHAGCSHQVQPRIIAQDTIHTLPETLKEGGKIGEKCFECAEKARREISLRRWAVLADKFQAARREAERRKTDEATEAMRKARKAFEQLPEDDYWVLTRMRHHQW
ncbi:hypothetical protein F4861DRAFT_521541 [Xylaria intraflava]|nr:hypothetical protein F4861DRAFT_521541 [Xylaria intraflava]